MRGMLAVGLAVALLAGACSGDDPGPGEDTAPVGPCDWPMWGRGPTRTFSYPGRCGSAITQDTVAGLEEAWFFNTDDVVTATPAVVGDTVYVGDWTGRFYAIERDDGTPRWTFRADPHEQVYAGQIVSSAAVADVDGERTVYFGGGKTLYALRAGSGGLRWKHELNPGGPADDPTEIETSPVVVDVPGRSPTVIIGYDVHNAPGVRAGLMALDAATGEVRWDFDPDRGAGPTGCVDVWTSPAVDVERGLVFAGTGNCNTSPDGWGPFTEAMFALDLRTGEPVWSYQPHEPNNDDLDFAGSPNVFTAGGTDLVGLGNKDGHYYAVDRAIGEMAWEVEATEPGVNEPGSNFSTGGFIGPTAVSDDGVIVGGTAVGPCPCLHGIDAATGEIVWQQDVAAPTYAATTIVGDVAFSGGTDFTLRAVEVATGDVRWEQEMNGPVAGGVAIQGDDVFAVAGLREPGQDTRAENSGVYRFTLPGDGAPAPTTTEAAPSTTLPTVTAFAPTDQPCVGSACPFEFSIKEPPAGADPAMMLEVAVDPAAVEVDAIGLGPPEGWLRPGSPAAAAGATSYAVFLSKGVDDPNGALVCVLEPVDAMAGADDDAADAGGDVLGCSSDALPDLGSDFDRLSVLAVNDTSGLPPIAEGYDRLVDTHAFDPALAPVP